MVLWGGGLKEGVHGGGGSEGRSTRRESTRRGSTGGLGEIISLLWDQGLVPKGSSLRRESNRKDPSGTHLPAPKSWTRSGRTGHP